MSIFNKAVSLCALGVAGVAAALLAAGPASAVERPASDSTHKKPVVAVFKIKQADHALKSSDVQFLVTALRTALGGGGVFEVLADDEIARAMNAMNLQPDQVCEDACMTELSRRVPADKRLEVTVWKSRQGCTLAAVMYDAKTTVTEQSTQAEGLECSRDGLAAGMEQVARAVSDRQLEIAKVAEMPSGVDSISESPVRRCMDCYAASLGGGQDKPPEVTPAAAVELVPIVVTGASASSELISESGLNAAANAIDGKTETWWAEAVAGINEWIELTWAAPTEIREIRLIGGFQPGTPAWNTRNRIGRVRIDISGGPGGTQIFQAGIEDRGCFQSIEVPAGTVGTTVRIRILQVYKGIDPTEPRSIHSGIAEIQVMTVK